MKILFIKLKHIGDALLMTPAIAGVKQKYPEAEIWVWVRKGSEGILKGCSAIDHLLTTTEPSSNNANQASLITDLKTLAKLRQAKLDYVFEFSEGERGRWLALACGARKRCLASSDNLSKTWSFAFHHYCSYASSNAHRAAKEYDFVQKILELEPTPLPLQFERNKADFSYVKKNQLDQVTVIHPSTRWKRKGWPLERWVTLCHSLEKNGHHLVISSGPDSEEIRFCQEIRDGVGSHLFLTEGALPWDQLAGLFYSARLFVGVDTAAMHLAAACQVPSIALFGPSVEEAWHPWLTRHAVITPQVTEDSIRRADGYPDKRLRKMEDITVAQVTEACLHYDKLSL